MRSDVREKALDLLADLAAADKPDTIGHALELASGLFAIGGTQEELDAALARRKASS